MNTTTTTTTRHFVIFTEGYSVERPTREAAEELSAELTAHGYGNRVVTL